MAYAALISLTQTANKLLNHDQYPFSFPGKGKVKSIYNQAISLQAFLEDLPETASSLEGQIRDVANEAEDIIEYFMSEQIRSHGGLIESAVRPSRTKRNKFRRKLGKVASKFDSIAAEATDIRNSFIIKDQGAASDFSTATSSSTYLLTSKDAMVGFDEHLMAIKARLCGESSKLQVIPIFGMGGIGKTTLARNAYDDPLIIERFEIRAWVTVSQDYCLKEILFGLLASMNVPKEEIIGQSTESMAVRVFKSLKARRYIIVMDDMWSTNAWDEVRNIFPDDDNGSRIILTTRLSDVAAYADPCGSLYEMHLMNADQSWNLFRQKVFTQHDCPPELEHIGKEIAKSCKGLPLAIVVIAGLLSTGSMTPASWREIAENVNSAVATENGDFAKILSLSYNHLPHRLRSCFLYMGGFPEDHEIRVSKLVKLWVAEGILKHENGSKTLEDEAEECLEDLIKRSLVLVTKRKSDGKIKSCSLHDLMRDLCIKKAYKEKFLESFTGGYVMKSKKDQRRISMSKFTAGYIETLSDIYVSTVHTLMCFYHGALYPVNRSLEVFRLLRVLDVGDEYVVSLPAQLFELFHLRYLGINYRDMIPAAISNLQNLQTLINCHARNEWRTYRIHANYFPQEIWRMPQLRHLVFPGRLPDLEGTTSALQNLITLSSMSYDMCTEEILKGIPNLKKLEIDCSNYEDSTYLNNLVYLHQLENLELRSFSSNAVWRKDSFTFPTMLKKLTLSRLALPWDEMTVVGSLPNLQVLKLIRVACKGDTWETTEGEFPQLGFLLIEESVLERWISESSHFPNLKFLLLHHCWRLSEIPAGIGEIPTLELIEIKGSENISLIESAKWIQGEQQSWGNDALQVRCY